MNACARCGGQGWTWGSGTFSTCTRCGGVGIEEVVEAEPRHRSELPPWWEMALYVALILGALWIMVEGAS